VQRKMNNEFDAPSLRVPDLRPAVDATIRLGLNADPQLRPPNVSEFIALLTGWKKIPADVQLPGNTLPDGSRRIMECPAHERRTTPRYLIEVSGSCRPLGGDIRRRWDLAIMDLSATGLCLQAKRRFETGSILEITFSPSPDDSVITHLARIRWNKAVANRAWVHGCEFIKPLPKEDLDALFADLMEHTVMR
jgi:hypothetical protein